MSKYDVSTQEETIDLLKKYKDEKRQKLQKIKTEVFHEDAFQKIQKAGGFIVLSW